MYALEIVARRTLIRVKDLNALVPAKTRALWRHLKAGAVKAHEQLVDVVDVPEASEEARYFGHLPQLPQEIGVAYGPLLKD